MEEELEESEEIQQTNIRGRKRPLRRSIEDRPKSPAVKKLRTRPHVEPPETVLLRRFCDKKCCKDVLISCCVAASDR